MVRGSIAQLVHLGWQMPRRIRRRPSGRQLADDLCRRLARRSASFLHLARHAIFDQPSSPYRQLLAGAGCEYGDLERSVRDLGVERTLCRLRDEGVYVDAPALRASGPIRHRGKTIQTCPSSFDNPLLATGRIVGKTSGTRSRRVSADYTWQLFVEEAAAEHLLLEAHGVGHRPLAIWYPGPPGVSGLHNLLVHLALGRPPRRWFSQVPPPSFRTAPAQAAALAFIRGCSFLGGIRSPRLEPVPADDPGPVLRWLREVGARRAVLKTYASSAVRLAAAATADGLDVRGCKLLTGGEALTRRRYDFIREAGFEVFARYAATEAGMLGGACGSGAHHDEVHLYVDRLAVIPGRPGPEPGQPDELLFTSLSPATPKLLLNASIGDHGRIEKRACGCVFGRLGLNTTVHDLVSPEKLTAEGMTVPSAVLADVIRSLVHDRGGSPDDAQLWLADDRLGIARLTVAVDPRLGELDEAAFLDELHARLAALQGGASLAAGLWQGAATLGMTRARPRRTAGDKLLPVIRHPESRDSVNRDSGRSRPGRKA